MKRCGRLTDTKRLEIHAHASAETVAMLRIGVFSLAAAEAWVMRGQMITIPAGAFKPFGYLTLLAPDVLDWMRSPAGWQGMCWFAFLTAVASVVGIVPRVAMPLATVALIVTQSVPRVVQGFVNHAQVPIILFALVLSLAPSTDALTLWPRRRVSPAPRDYQSTVVLMLTLLCLGYLFIAAHRVAYGGWELFSSDSLTQWLIRRNLNGSNPDASLGVIVARNPILATIVKASFPLITALELSAPLCVLSRRYRWFFVPCMLTVHVSIFLLMHISFSQLAFLYVVFIDSQYWSPRRIGDGVSGTVFFDGVCGLCNRFVDFLLPRDTRHRLRFAPLQGTTAVDSLPASLVSAATMDSVIYAESGRIYSHSTGALAALSRLGGLWSFASVFGLVPRPIRDAVYDWIARNRYQWFGKHDQCRLPAPSERQWFLP